MVENAVIASVIFAFDTCTTLLHTSHSGWEVLAQF